MCWGDGLRGVSSLELCWLSGPANARHGLQMLASTPDTLQSALSVLGQGASNSVPMVSRSGVSISHSPPVLQIINPLGFYNRIGGVGLLLPALHQGWGALCRAKTSCFLGRMLWFVMTPPFQSTWPKGPTRSLLFCSCPSQRGSFSMLVVEGMFCWFQVIFSERELFCIWL